MSLFRNMTAIGLVAGALAGAAPASAVVTTFASFNPVNSTRNMRWEKVGVDGGKLYTTSTGTATVPGGVAVKFTFLQAGLNPYINSIGAVFFFSANTSGDAASLSTPNFTQNIDSGSFSFVTAHALDIGSHHFAAGANLLSGTFTNAKLFGPNGGTSGSLSDSTSGGATIVYTSDFLDFSPTISRDFALALTSINPALNRPTSALNSLRTFRATASGTFASDPAPLITALPEPADWALLLTGFALTGVVARRRATAIATA